MLWVFMQMTKWAHPFGSYITFPTHTNPPGLPAGPGGAGRLLGAGVEDPGEGSCWGTVKRKEHSLEKV